jgi:hypothetical protein
MCRRFFASQNHSATARPCEGKRASEITIASGNGSPIFARVSVLQCELTS